MRGLEALDLSGGFDVHGSRHGLTLRQQDRETIYLANRASVARPSCDRRVERLLVSEKRTHIFDAPGAPFCVVRTDEQLLVLTH